MAGWKRIRRILAGIAVIALFVAIGTSCCANRQERRLRLGDPDAPPAVKPQDKIDLKEKPLDRIPVGTVIGRRPPERWSNLVLLAIPTLTREDERDAPRMATHYAKMFKFTILANVARRGNEKDSPFYLERVARGFATTVDGKQVIVSGKDTLGADLGLFGRRILDENEKVLDNDVRQVVRTATMLIFDAQAVMLRGGEHVNMIMRHALLVDPASGRLYTLVWLLTRDYKPAEKVIQLLPDGMREQRMLSIKRDKFSRLGIPERDAFGLRQVPQGKPIDFTEDLKKIACIKTFDEAKVPQIEETLRATAMQAAGR
jgi:hypothetical protein